MSLKVVKVVAVPVVLGFASVRVYAMSEAKTEHLLSPRELSIYSSDAESRLQPAEEHPGVLQRGFSKVRGSLQSSFHSVKGAFVSAKMTAVNLYHGGEDIYHFLKDPPAGFVPRVAVISVSGLAGVILARKGSRLKRLGLPLSLASAGFAVCYPVQTIALLKVSGKKVFTASQWTSSTVSSLWRSPALPNTSEPPQPSEVSSKNEPDSPETGAAGTEESSQEILPGDQLSFTSGSEEQDVLSAEEDLIQEENSPPSSPQTNQNQPETPSPHPTGESLSPTVVTEKQKKIVDQKLLDFGQSNPEDADLYTTRS